MSKKFWAKSTEEEVLRLRQSGYRVGPLPETKVPCQIVPKTHVSETLPDGPSVGPKH